MSFVERRHRSRSPHRGGRNGESETPSSFAEESEDAQELDVLVQTLDGRLDATALKVLGDLPTAQAVRLLRDVVAQGDSVRNPSAFVVGAVRSSRKPGTFSANQRSNVPQGNGADAGVRSMLQNLLQDIDIDASARSALETLAPQDQVSILTELVAQFTKVRNKSAFVLSAVRRTEGRDDRPSGKAAPRQDESRKGGGSISYGKGNSHIQMKGGSHSHGMPNDRHDGWEKSQSQDDGGTRGKVCSWIKNCDLIDERAKSVLLELEPTDSLHIMQELVSKGNTIRNPSAFVFKIALETARGKGTSRPLGDPSAEYSKAGGAAEASRGQRRGGVPDAPGDNPLDRPFAFEMEQVFPTEVASHSTLPSSVVTAFSSAPDGGARTPREHFAGGHAEAASDGNGDWRSMDLSTWLRSVDGGRNLLVEYEPGLLANYDTLSLLVELYVERQANGSVKIDPAFFEDVGVAKLGHRRLFEKWFKEKV